MRTDFPYNYDGSFEYASLNDRDKAVASTQPAFNEFHVRYMNSEKIQGG